jgi:hypothetical protein
MRFLKTSAILAVMLAVLSACSTGFAAAPTQSSQSYHDQLAKIRLSPDDAR